MLQIKKYDYDYDDVLSIEQEDVLFNAVKAVDKNLDSLKRAILVRPSTWKPADI